MEGGLACKYAMDILDQLDAVKRGKLDRRRFMKALTALGVSVAALSPRGLRGASDPLVYLTWTGYEEPAIHHQYRQRYGMVPQTVFFSDLEEALTKLKTGLSVDMAHSDAYILQRWVRSGRFQPIPTGSLSNLPRVFSELYDFPGNSTAEGLWFVPFDWGHTSIIYRTDLYQPEGPESWDILWDKRLAGRLGGMQSAQDTWLTAAIKEGVDFDHLDSPEAFDRVAAALREQNPFIREYYKDVTTMCRAMANGEVIAALAWNDALIELQWAGAPVKFAAPKEGRLIWIGGLMLHRDTKYPERAVEAINSMLSTTAGQFIIGEYGYGHANRDSFDVFPKAHLERIGMSGDILAELAMNHLAMPQDDSWYKRMVKDVTAIRYGY